MYKEIFLRKFILDHYGNFKMFLYANFHVILKLPFGRIHKNVLFIFSVSGGSATVYAYLGEFHTNQARSKAIMGAAVIFAIAVLLIPGCAWLVINQSFQIYIPFLDIVYKPWRLFLLVCGIPSLICALCLFVIPESPKYTLLYKGQAETIQILSRIYSINTGNARETYPVSPFIFSYYGKKNKVTQKKHLSRVIIELVLKLRRNIGILHWGS